MIFLSSTESKYAALLECEQQVKFINMILQVIYEVQKSSIAYEDNKLAIFLANNIQSGMRNKHINILYLFPNNMVKERDIDINYIRVQENPMDIMSDNSSEDNHVKETKSIIEGKLWELVEFQRGN